MKMFKNLAVLGGALCAAGFLSVAPALAGVVDSRHDVTSTLAGNVYRTAFSTLADFGTCSACHIPHGAGGEKLFPKAATGGTGAFFGPLCGSCHDSSAFTGAPVPVNLYVNNTAFDANAHGLDIADLTAQGSDGVLTSTTLAHLAEVQTAGKIECLSCHDVHNQRGQRPFLMVSIDTLCNECHINRENNLASTTGYANTLGTHPAGAYFTGDMGTNTGVVLTATSSPMISGGLGTIMDGLNAIMANNTDTDADGSSWPDAVWNSGAHLEGGAGGGVSCVTCHIVHWDEVSLDNGSEFLGFVDGGQAGLENNAFCEACHQGSATGSGTGYFWNPGGTANSHPNDDVRAGALTPADVGNFPLAPPNTTSATSGDGTVSALVCTSCHGIHRSDDTAVATQPNSPALLPYAGADICTECHNSNTLPFNHHPVGTGVYATAGNNANNVTCAGGDLGAGIGTCHAATGGASAHNRASAMGLGVDTNYSQMCMNCHTDNPSAYTLDSSAYNANGSASHFVGDVTAEAWTRTTGMTGGGTTGAIRWAGDQSTAGWAGSGLASKFGAANTDMICESCHRLAEGNIISGDNASNGVAPYETGTSMLVEVAGAAIMTDTADGTVEVADYTDAEYLCTGCHLVPSGTHPLADADNGVYPDTGWAGPEGQSYPATGLNCESCHSPHDANTSSGSYILDGAVENAVDKSDTFGNNTDGMAVEPGIDYTTFCAVCHSNFK